VAFVLRLSGRDGLKWRLLPVVRFCFRLVGKDWNHFYAWMLNRQERATDIADVVRRNKRDVSGPVRKVKGLYDVSAGALYVEFLERQGLKATHRLLDFGCGYGRMAIPLLGKLEAGNYVGVDLSRERIRQAHDYVALEGLGDRRPVFHVANMDNDMSYLGEQKFDVVWVHSVLGHMPLDDVRRCLGELAKRMAPDGFLIANYAFADEIEVKNISAFYVPEAMMQELVEGLGFTYATVDDFWTDRIAPERVAYEKMMRLTLAT